VHVFNDVLLLDDAHGSADEVQIAEFECLHDLCLERQVHLQLQQSYFDVGGAFGQHHFEFIVFSQERAHGVQVREVEGKQLRLVRLVEQVVLVPDVVALVPISLPLPENVEARLDLEVHFVFVSVGVGGGNVADEVEVVEVVDVAREFSREALDRGVPRRVAVLGHLIIISPRKLPLYLRCLVLNRQILVHSDITPVRYYYFRLRLCEDGHGLVISEMDHYLLR